MTSNKPSNYVLKLRPCARWVFTFFLCCLSLFSAQAAITLTGRIASATDDEPVVGATLRLMTLPDSTFVAGAYADAKGHFTLNTSRVKPARRGTKVLLLITSVGFQDTYKQIPLRAKQETIDLKDIYLQEDERLLGETVVSATPPPMVIREDTIEFYADSYKTQPDATVEDLMKRLPGVEVAEDGTITAQGETVTQVYVDGKEFFGNNQQATTKNLTADMVESVQVVDMQTEESRLTGVDNGERRKVINLKLKPKMRRGMFGNLGAGWGKGSHISDRYGAGGMMGYFRGNSQNALVMNANNTNNAGFGDLGDRAMSHSSMRGGRQSGKRGSGLSNAWSVGLNIGYDKGNRMRDPNTPLALGGNVLYGGSSQAEESKKHRVNYLSSGNTVSDSYSTGDNDSHNWQADFKWEQSWGDLKDGQHRVQVAPTLAFNTTNTDDYSETRNAHEDGAYISQTQRRNQLDQQGYNLGLNATYSYAKKVTRGRRRTSLTLGIQLNHSDGDQYTRSMTSYADHYIDLDRRIDPSVITLQPGDTLINQWQKEKSNSNSYRLRLTHVEPLAEHHMLEFSAAANLRNNYSQHDYLFWDKALGEWSDHSGSRYNTDYNSDTHAQNTEYNLSASYRYSSTTTNVSVGMDVMPQHQSYADALDPSRDYKRNFVNYAPRFEYRYNWSRRTNLRITLNGSTTQPSQSQLQARKNQTSATHVSLGNKDLKPSMRMQFQARFRHFSEETYNTFEASLNATANFNSLASKRWYSEGLRTDTTMTVNLDGVGQWHVGGNFRGSFPFYDNLWYLTTNTEASVNVSKGYASIKSTDSQLNRSTSWSGAQQLGIAYRSEFLNVELRGNWRMQYDQATIVTSGNLGATHNFGVSGNVTAHLPWSLTFSTDCHYTARRGYSSDLNRNQCLWNAQLSRSCLNRKNLSFYIKGFDLLRQRAQINRSVSATQMTDSETSVLGQYFLVGFTYKFNRMGAGRRGGNRGGRSERGGFPGGFDGPGGGRDDWNR